MKWSVFSMVVGIVLSIVGAVCWWLGGIYQPFASALIFGIVFLAVGIVLYIRTKGEFKPR